MKIDQIQVGFRYRKDLGDVRALAQSIEEVGLLHPIVVTPEGRLIAGQRRLEACRLLEWTEVPVTVVDLYQAARGEAHENFVRKDLLPSEIVALKRAIEPIERREARERQGIRADLRHPASVVVQRGHSGDARDNIARYLGAGRTTIERAEAVVEAAEDDPEEYGHLVEQMDTHRQGGWRLSKAGSAKAGTAVGSRRPGISDKPISGHCARSTVAV